MRKSPTIIFIILSVLLVGCNSTAPKEESTIPGIRESFYQEGIRYVNLYSSEDYITRNYNDWNDLSADEASVKHKDRIRSIKSVMREYKGRAESDAELLFVEKLTPILESAPMISVLMTLRDSMGTNDYISGRMNEFYTAINQIKDASRPSPLLPSHQTRK
jgi:hypothetical protein